MQEWKDEYEMKSLSRWDEVRCAKIRAELGAYYARLYGLTRDELRYILDPKEVHGEDFPGETFRVVKEKEIRLFGDALRRTSRLAEGGGVGWSGSWLVKDKTVLKFIV